MIYFVKIYYVFIVWLKVCNRYFFFVGNEDIRFEFKYYKRNGIKNLNNFDTCFVFYVFEK